MSGIFISYRREDSQGWAGRISDRLKQHFGDQNVFLDVDGISIPLGQSFADVIADRLRDIDAAVVVIGEEWLSAVDDDTGTRRLDDPDDFVRAEIAAALASGALVVPVLVDDAEFPKADSLPEDIRELASKNGLEVAPTRFDEDTNRLIAALEPVTPELSALDRLMGAMTPSRWMIFGAVLLALVAVITLVTVSSGATTEAAPTATTITSAVTTTAPPATTAGRAETTSAPAPTTSAPATTISTTTPPLRPDDLVAVSVDSLSSDGIQDEYAVPVAPEDLSPPAGECQELADWAAASDGVPTSPSPSGISGVGIVVQGTSRLQGSGVPVAVTGMTVNLVNWETPMVGSRIQCLTLPLTDGPPPVGVDVVFPASPGGPVTVRYSEDGEPISTFPRQTLAGGETLLIDVWIDASACLCDWTATLHTVVDGQSVDFPIDNDGEPFRVTGGSRAVPLYLGPDGLTTEG